MICSMPSDAGSSLAAIRAVKLRPSSVQKSQTRSGFRTRLPPKVTRHGNCACAPPASPAAATSPIPDRSAGFLVRRLTTACAGTHRGAWHPGRDAEPAARPWRRCRRARHACRPACPVPRSRLRRCSRSPSAPSGKCALEVLDPGDARQLRPVVGPGVITTKRARMSSPRLVVNRQRLIDSSQRTCAPGWRRSRRRRARNACRFAAVLEDLGAVGELLRRDEVEFFQHRDVAVRIVVALDPGKRFQYQTPPKSPPISMTRTSSTPAFLRYAPASSPAIPPPRTATSMSSRSGRGASPAYTDRPRRSPRSRPSIRGTASILLGADACRARADTSPAALRCRCRPGSGSARRCRTMSSVLILLVKNSRGSPVPMYLDSWVCRLTVLRSRYGLGLVPGKPSDFMPCCTAAMLEKSCGRTDSQSRVATGVYCHSVCGSSPSGYSSNTATSKMHLLGS